MSLLFDVDRIQTKRNEALESRRYGRLIISKTLLETAPEAIQKLYAKIVPVEVKYDFAREAFDVTALSEDFDPTEPARMIPYYHVTIRCQQRKTGTGKAYYFIFTKVEVE